MSKEKGTSWEEIYNKTIVAVLVLNTDEEMKITTRIYDGLHKGNSFRSPKGTVFKLKDVKKIIPIDDYK